MVLCSSPATLGGTINVSERIVVTNAVLGAYRVSQIHCGGLVTFIVDKLSRLSVQPRKFVSFHSRNGKFCITKNLLFCKDYCSSFQIPVQFLRRGGPLTKSLQLRYVVKPFEWTNDQAHMNFELIRP